MSDLKKISAELRAIADTVEKLASHPAIHKIDMDLALDKIRNVYDKLSTFNYSDSDKKTAVEFNKIPESKVEKTADVVIKEEKILEIEPFTPETNKETPRIISVKEEPKSHVPHEHKEVHHEHHAPPARHSSEILADKFKSEQPLINEAINRIEKKDISSMMQAKSIKNIEAAIGINERFLFTRELFSGDAETFQKTIRILNNVANFNEAFNYINNTFNWDLESEAAQKLLDLVRRRYIINE